LNTKKITELIREKNPDFIYLNSMYSYRFSILPLLISWRNNIAAHFILAPRGMLHVGALQFKTFKKKFFIRLLNLTGIPKNLMFHATDDQEKTDILKQFPQAKAVWEIPNFSAPLPQDWHVIEKKPGVLKVVYISRIIPKKNLLFFLTLVRNLPEDIQLQINIYGGIEDINYWEQSKELIASFPKNISVSEFGALAHEKVTATLDENHVFILPSKGENFGHAIFESWSAGRPCMISDQTPWHNLQNKMAGWDLPLDNKNSWIHALIQAGSWDQSAFNSWCKNSRAFAERHVGQATLKKDYIKLFS
jgi:glycosyltransferase involved in cell wall biosynthesis